MTYKKLTYALSLIACAALLLATTRSALAVKGGKTAVALTFDDLPGDAIQSDGFGSYAGRRNRDGDLVISTGSRAMHFDFSSPLTWWSLDPFNYGTEAGEIESVTMTVTLLNETSGTVEFEFSGLDPEREGTTKFSLTMSVSITPSESGYSLEASSDAELMYLYQYTGPRGNGRFYPPYWERGGIFEMPWSGEVSP